MNWQQVFQLIVSVLAVAGGLGGAIGYLSSSRAQSTIKVQDDNIKALEKKVDILEIENDECEKRTTYQGEQIKILTETVTHAADVNKLVELSQDQHKDLLRIMVNQHKELLETIHSATQTKPKPVRKRK